MESSGRKTVSVVQTNSRGLIQLTERRDLAQTELSDDGCDGSDSIFSIQDDWKGALGCLHFVCFSLYHRPVLRL